MYRFQEVFFIEMCDVYLYVTLLLKHKMHFNVSNKILVTIYYMVTTILWQQSTKRIKKDRKEKNDIYSMFSGVVHKNVLSEGETSMLLSRFMFL